MVCLRNALVFSGFALLLGALVVPGASAKECTLLKVVGLGSDDGASPKSGGIRKSISPAGTGITSNNWNTDFAIADGDRYDSFRVQITPDSDGQYDLVSYLKYPNEKSQSIYERKGISLGKGKTLSFSARPSSKSINPYQVNVYFGGTLSTGKSYVVSAYGCK